MSNKEIIYPIFLECCKETESIFWKTIFDDLSKGITPYGIYISKDFLCCNFKGKEFSYKIEEKDPTDLFFEVFDIFKNKFGLMSMQEKVEKRVVFDNIKDNLKKNKQEWSNIRKKNVKTSLIEKFVLKNMNQYNLNIKQCKKIISIITICLFFKIISNNDIVYENTEIIEIKGIQFSHKKISLDKDVFLKKYNDNPPKIIKEENKLMLKSWQKLLKDLTKNEI